MTLSDLITQFIDNDNTASVVALNDQYAIIDNPSFSILPNYPYRNPLVIGVYCTAGDAKGRVNTKIFNISKGDFMIILPGQITELVDLSDNFSATYVIMSDSFTESLGIGNTFSLRNIVVSSPYMKLSDQAQKSFEGYISMCRNLIPIEENPNRLEILQLLTRAFFLGLGYFMHNSKHDMEDRNEELTNSFISLVERNYTKHRELEYYADKLNLTAKHVSRVVKLSSGKSATEWIEKYVILDAISQLLSTNRSVKEIAYHLNFPSQSCFGKYFYRITGISPTLYRKKHKH